MREDKVYLQHILDEIDNAEDFIGDIKKDEFCTNISETQYAVVRCLEIVGEAASKISEDLKNNSKDIPWVEITGMRNKIIHEYMSIDYNVVWDTVNKDLPLLKKQISRLLN